MSANVLRMTLGVCMAMMIAVNASAGTGCGDCSGCASGADCVTVASADCGPTYETRTVMRPQYVTETRMVPHTTYQRETRTRMRTVNRRVARVETKTQTYTVNVPHQKTRTETYNVQVCVPYRQRDHAE